MRSALFLLASPSATNQGGLLAARLAGGHLFRGLLYPALAACVLVNQSAFAIAPDGAAPEGLRHLDAGDDETRSAVVGAASVPVASLR